MRAYSLKRVLLCFLVTEAHGPARLLCTSRSARPAGCATAGWIVESNVVCYILR